MSLITTRVAQAMQCGDDMTGSDEEHCGLAHFRSIKPWRFAAQALLEPEKRAKMSIGTLHVKVKEARGLMARDGIIGKSDPYVKLDLSGRYRSNGQEWSEELRIQAQTRTIKYSLNPVWNETFALPVRRAGAFLRVELWDWDRGSADDPLGSFEVEIGEELLSQKAADMWFVLSAPRDLQRAASAVPDVTATRPTEAPQLSEAEEHVLAEEEMAEMQTEAATSLLPVKWKDILARKVLGSGGELVSEHDHRPGEESKTCDKCIRDRRERFGEVRLELRFEYSDFAETCSHIWPEEPPKPAAMEFSPNRVYYNALLLQQLTQPYVRCMLEANAVVHWIHPWKSLLWFMAWTFLLLHPCLLVAVFNGWCLWIVVTAYLDHTRIRQNENSEGSAISEIETARVKKSKNKRSSTAPRHSLLPPIDEPADRKLQDMYRTVRRTKKLPVVVERFGRRTFATSALPPQRQIEFLAKILMKFRRHFHPVAAGTCAATVIALACHTILQIWLLKTSRFNLYLLGCCAAVFVYNFYVWRGRAFVAGVREAARCRQIRMAFAGQTSTAASKIDYFSKAKSSTSVTSFHAEQAPFDGQEARSSRPAFAPPGTIPVDIDGAATYFFEGSPITDQNSARGRHGHRTGGTPTTVKMNTPEAMTNQQEQRLSSADVEDGAVPEKGGGPKAVQQRSVRFEEDPASRYTELSGAPVGRPATRQPLLAPFFGKGGLSPGSRDYGSADQRDTRPSRSVTDEPDADVRRGEEKGEGPAVTSRTARRPWSSKSSETQQNAASIVVYSDDQDSPQGTGTRGWREKVSRWYHDF